MARKRKIVIKDMAYTDNEQALWLHNAAQCSLKSATSHPPEPLPPAPLAKRATPKCRKEHEAAVAKYERDHRAYIKNIDAYVAAMERLGAAFLMTASGFLADVPPGVLSWRDMVFMASQLALKLHVQNVMQQESFGSTFDLGERL